MIRTYEEALSWIHGRLRFGVKPGLIRMRWMLKELGNPERAITAVHIAGTNGKGSTVTYLRNMVEAAGYEVGTFTSPYIESFNERISINGEPISDAEMVKLVNEVKPVVEKLEGEDLGPATEFEVITVMAFLYFGKIRPLDLVIFETGLGGRYDSTNVVSPILTMITNIGFDHMAILGSTVEQIAGEKAGIIKHEVPLITTVEQDEAKKVIEQEVSAKQAPSYWFEKDFTFDDYQALENGEQFSLRTPFGKLEKLQLSMMGYHQVKNASLAAVGALYMKDHGDFSITDDHIRQGLQKSQWMARFEKVRTSPTIIIDGAHNEEGVKSLVDTLRLHYETKRIHILFTCLNDKESTGMIRSLEEVADTITFTSFDFPRAEKASTLYNHAASPNKYMNEDWKQAIASCKERLKDEDDILIITGSLYFIGEVRKSLKNK